MKRSEIAQYDVFCGIDVGKASHYMAVFDRDCDDPLMRGPVAQDEAELRDALSRAAALGSRMLVTVDQCGAFGRLAVAVAKDMGLDVAHIPPRKFKQVLTPMENLPIGTAAIILDRFPMPPTPS